MLVAAAAGAVAGASDEHVLGTSTSIRWSTSYASVCSISMERCCDSSGSVRCLCDTTYSV